MRTLFSLNNSVRFILLFFGIVAFALAQAQSLVEIPSPTGFAFQGSGNNTIVYNGSLYTLYTDPGNGHNGHLMAYDGSNFTDVPLPSGYDGASGGYSFEGYAMELNGNLYIRGRNNDGDYYLLEYDGSTMTEIPNPATHDGDGSAGFGYSTYRGMVYQGNLYLIYRGDDENRDIFKFDGATLTEIPSPAGYENPYRGASGFLGIVNNELYCYFWDNNAANYVLKYDGSSFTPIPLPSGFDGAGKGIGAELIEYNSSTYFILQSNSDNYVLHRYNAGNNTLTAFANPPGYTGSFAGCQSFATEFNGELLFRFRSDGDGVNHLFTFDGNSFTEIPFPLGYSYTSNSSGFSSGVTNFDSRLFLHYSPTSGPSRVIYEWDGTTFTELAMPSDWNAGFNGTIVRDTLFFGYQNTGFSSTFSAFDGNTFTTIPDPSGYTGNPGTGFNQILAIYNTLIYTRFQGPTKLFRYGTPCDANTSAFSAQACNSYTVPSGDETYTTEGTYTVMDTIINHCGGDSVMTITISIGDAYCGLAGALAFDGVDDYVSVPDNPGFDFGNSSFSFETWLRIPANSAGEEVNVIGDFMTSTTSFSMLSKNASDHMQFSMRNSSSVSDTVESPTPLDNGEWNHVAGVYDATQEKMSLYINGNLVDSGTHPGGDCYSGQGLFLGSGHLNRFMAIEMEETRIWGRAFCEEEIQSRMNCELTGDENDLLAYFNYNNPNALGGGNNPGQTVAGDSSGNGLDATLINFDLLNGPVSNWIPQLESVDGTCTTEARPEIVVKGNGHLILDGDDTPIVDDNTDFGVITPNTNICKTFTIKNVGVAPLTIDSLYLTGTDSAFFSIDQQPASVVAVDDSTSFSICYQAGSQVVIHDATMHIISSDCGETNYNYDVRATVQLIAALADTVFCTNGNVSSVFTNCADALTSFTGPGTTFIQGTSGSADYCLYDHNGGDCNNFTANGCNDGFATGSNTHSQVFSHSSVTSIDVTVYHLGCGNGITTYLNGNQVDYSFGNGQCACTPSNYAYSFTLQGGDLSSLTGTNDQITVSTSTYLSGISVTVNYENPSAVEFDPSAAGVGTHTINVSACGQSTSFNVEVEACDADYAIETTGGEIVISDLKDNSDSLDISESSLRVDAPGRTYSLNGGGAVAFPASLSLSGINSIVLNTFGGDDTVTIGSFASELPSLTINGGTGNDVVNFKGDATFASNANLELNLQDDAIVPGSDRVVFGTNTNVALQGNGMAGIRVSRDVFLNSGSSLETVNGELLIETNLQEIATGGEFSGLELDSGRLEVTGTGQLTINTKGGDAGMARGVYARSESEIIGGNTGENSIQGWGGAGSQENYGVEINGGSILSANGTGNVNVMGTGGPSAGNSNTGVAVRLDTAMITSNGGDVFVTGAGGGTGSAQANVGVLVAGVASITAGTSGNVTVNGTGGASSSGGFNPGVQVAGAGGLITSSDGNVMVTGVGGGGANSSFRNHGIYVSNSGEINAGGDGTVTIDGSAGIGNGDSGSEGNNCGIRIEQNGLVTSSGGDVSVTGLGGGSLGVIGGANQGVLVRTGGAITAGGTGNINVTGTAGVDNGYNDGINVTSGSEVSTSGGNVSINGYGGTVGDNGGDGVFLYGGHVTSSGGNININGTAGGYLGSPGSGGFGVELYNGVLVQTGNNGFVNIQATGSLSSANTAGFIMSTNSEISTVDGNIDISGIAGNGIGPTNYGTFIGVNAFISSTGAGDVNITGVAGTEATGKPGILLQNNSAISTHIGDIFLSGTASPTDVNPAADIWVYNGQSAILSDSGRVTFQALENGFRPQTDFTEVSVSPADTIGFTTGSKLLVELSGTAPNSGYTQFNLEGKIDLSGAELALHVPWYVPSPGEEYIIINNDSNDAVIGTFTGLPEGAIIDSVFTGCAPSLSISYIGGDGNDVVLTTVDVEDPIFTSSPADTSVSALFDNCFNIVNWTSPTATDNCPDPISITSNFSPGSLFPVGVTQVIYHVEDVSGNRDTATFNVTITDDQNPEITGCPSNIVVNNDAGECGANVSWTSPTASDNCPGVSMTASHLPGVFFPVGTTTVTYVAEDQSGNLGTCSFNITVIDNEVPQAMCQDLTVYLDSTGSASITSAELESGSTDNCGIASVIASDTTFNCAEVGANAITVTVTDVNGNSSSCNATVTVLDNTNPIAICQDITVELNGNGLASIQATQIDNGSSDECGIDSMSVSPNNFDCSDVGPNQVTLTVTDVNGNSSSCNATVTIEDNIAPVALCKNVTLPLNSNGNAFVSSSNLDDGSYDNCSVTFSLSQNSFDCSNLGDNNITLTVTDPGGNSDTCVSIVTIVDEVSPTALCQDITVQLDTNGSASISAADVDAGSWDVCGPIDTIYLDNYNFNCGDVGDNQVQLTVMDEYGNDASCAATVAVMDTVSPIAVCQDMTIYLDANGTASISAGDIDNGSSDACGIASVSVDQENFDCGNVGQNTVTLAVEDNNGNISSCTSTVTVLDTISPNAVCQDITVELNGIGQAFIEASDIDFGSSDACGIDTIYLDQYDFDCSNIGANTVTLTVVNVNGNSSSCAATITVEDNEAPSITCPANISVSSDTGECSAVVSFSAPAASDNCGNPTVLQVDNTGLGSGSTFPVGTTTLEYEATDDEGNSSSCSFTVTVNDNEAPVIDVPDNITVCAENGNGATVTFTGPDYSDNCGISSTSQTTGQASGSFFQLGVTTNSYSVTDENGNTTTAFFTVTVIPGPEAAFIAEDVCFGSEVQFNNNSTPGMEYSWDFDDGNISTEESPSHLYNMSGVYNVSLTVTDTSNGCFDTYSQSLEVFGELSLSASSTGPSCYGGNDGTIVVLANGAAPFQYSLNNGVPQADDTFTGLIAANYLVEVIDTNGCSNETNVDVTEPDSISFTTVVNADVNCLTDNDGSITITANGGTAPYLYSIDGGNNFSSGTFSFLSGGDHLVVIEDSQGCIYTGTATVPVQIPFPVADFSFLANELTVEFSDLSQNADTYWWDFDDGNTSTDPEPTHTYFEDGGYTVTQIVDNDCGSDTTMISLGVLMGTSIGGLQESIIVNLYPNPNNGQFTIDLGTMTEGLTLTIRNALGQLISTQYYDRVKLIEAEIVGETGLYMLELRTKDGRSGLFKVVME